MGRSILYIEKKCINQIKDNLQNSDSYALPIVINGLIVKFNNYT